MLKKIKTKTKTKIDIRKFESLHRRLEHVKHSSSYSDSRVACKLSGFNYMHTLNSSCRLYILILGRQAKVSSFNFISANSLSSWSFHSYKLVANMNYMKTLITRHSRALDYEYLQFKTWKIILSIQDSK